MLCAVLCVLCVQIGGSLMNIPGAGDADPTDVFSSLGDECGSLTGCLKSLKSPAVPRRSVSVSCGPSAMLVHVKADLFDLGAPVNPRHLSLGERCGVSEASSQEFIIRSALTDCGTRYWLTDDSLVYTNVLVYAPVPSVHGVIRQKRMSVPVQCVYSRRFSVDAVSVVPMWLPHLSTHSAEHSLHFSLRLMTSDWQVMKKGTYLLGDVINMEVSVFAPLLELWVFVQDCVATLTRDAESVPRYKFIENGCFADGQQTNSMSHYLPRIQTNKLHLQLHTSIFRQVHSTQIFISCSLKAGLQSSSSSRACSYIYGSWRSADGDHSVCESCQMSDQFGQKQNVKEHTQVEPGEAELGIPRSLWRNPEQTDAPVLKQEVQVGPLSLSSWRSEMLPPEVLEGVDSTRAPSFKIKRLTAHLLQGNASMPGSERSASEAVAQESGVFTQPELDVVLATPTPELNLTVPALMFTTPETIHSTVETKSTVAEVPGTAEVPKREGPDAEGPDAEGPDAEGPDAEGPDAEGPDAEGPDAEGPDAEGPDNLISTTDHAEFDSAVM